METQTQHPPSARDVKVGSGIPNFRFADGQIVRGREIDNTLESVDKLVGYFRRVGVHRGVLDDGREYAKLEIEMDTADHGRCSVGVNLTSLMASITLAEGILAIQKDELIAVAAGRGKERNKYGNFTTYANLYHVDPNTLASKQAKEKRLNPGAKLDDIQEDILEEIANHPAYGERAPREGASADSADSGGLVDTINQKRKWPMVNKETWPGYAKLASALQKKLTGSVEEYKSWADVPQEVLNTMRELHYADGRIPGPLKAYPLTPKGANDEYDPFADE